MGRVATGALLALLSLLAACTRDAGAPATSAPPVDLATQVYAARPWVLDAAQGSAQPDLIAAPHGKLLLVWISSEPGRRPALLFGAYDGARWLQASRTIAVGTALFANWADTPHLAATDDGAYWVHWLQKNPAAEGASDVLLSRSLSNGRSWSAPVLVNDDGTPTEHGFASLWPQTESSLGVAWLDGRMTTPAAAPAEAATPAMTAMHAMHAKPAHAARSADAAGPADAAKAAMPAMQHAWPTGPMTLRAAVFDNNMQRQREALLDADTCNCCQTDVALTGKGALLAWRDHGDGDVRDIATARFDGTTWTQPSPVHADGWVVHGCPVNGPAIAARGDVAVVGWYTAANDKPTVQLALSRDAGAHFDAPVVVAQGASVLGRVDVAFDGTQAWVAWLEETPEGQRLRLARYSADLSQRYQVIEVAALARRGGATGYPKLAMLGGDVYAVWTDVIAGKPRLQGAVVSTR